MNTNFLHHGKGKPLHATNISGVFTEPRTATIPAGGYSEPFSSSALEIILRLEFAGDVSGDEIDIESSNTSAFTTSKVYQTEAITGDHHFWGSGQSIPGIYRIHNRTTEAVNVWMQERIN